MVTIDVESKASELTGEFPSAQEYPGNRLLGLLAYVSKVIP
jgi:hypothetical protein